MCGRFILTSTGKDLAEHFGLMTEPELSGRYNIAPTQEVATIRLEPDGNSRRLTYLKWGLVPSWAKDQGSVKVFHVKNRIMDEIITHKRCL
jgi:putative SOS response-associated peptidase YedK